MNEVEALSEENDRLRRRIAQLEEQLRFLTTHKTVAAGISGERIISDLINGTLTSYAASFDVLTPTGLTIEVKKAGLSKATPNRWQWGKVLGERGAKKYDYLLLVGEADSRFAHLYRDAGSPFVLFCVPFEAVEKISTTGQQQTRIARVATNPEGVRSAGGRMLFKEFEVTLAELEQRFGLRG